MNLVIKQTRVVEVPVTTLNVCQSIMAMTTMLDADGVACGQSIFPTWIPQVLEIDLATGQIKNWNVPTGEQLQHIADAYADGQSAAVAPTPLTEQSEDWWPPNSEPKRRCPISGQMIPFEFETVAALCPDAPNNFYAAFYDAQATTPAPPQAVESAAVREDLQADCAPAGQQSNLVESNQIKPVEIDTFNASEIMPDTVAVLEKYATDMPILADEPTEQAQPATVREQFAEFLAERGIEPSAPKPTNQVSVHYDQLAEKWHAETNEHQATSTQGKFEAIKNVLKKANLHGVYEINRIEDELYSYDGSRTLNADTVYMTQGADGAWSARMPNNRPVSAVVGIDGALTGLLKEMEGIQPEDAVIIETTDDEMRSRNKRRYAVTAKHEHAPVETSTAIPVDLPSVAPTAATVEPVADPDDVVPVCTLKQKLEPLPAITDNGDLPSDFDGGDASDDKLDVTVATRENGEFVATTGAGATYVRASSRTDAEAALKNLLKKCGMIVSDTAIVETTSTYDSVQLKRRFSVDTSFAQYEPLPVNADPVAQIDIEEAIAEAPESADTVIQPAPVEAVTKLNMHPSVVRDQLSFASANQADPIYVAFFTARGLMEDGKLSSKGFRLLANLGEARGIGSATQMIENAIEVVEKPATYAEIVALINHATEKMQVVKLIDRIAKHDNDAERKSLYVLQQQRIDAFNADSAA